MATITVTCGTGISGVAWRQYNSSGSQIDSGTFGGTKSWTASSGYLMIYPNRADGYNHPIYYTRTDGYTQTITNANGTDNDRKISFTQNKSGTVTATPPSTPTTYTITYNANGGTGAPAAQTKTKGVNLTLSSTKPTRTGYDFVNWFDGTDYYNAGGIYTADSPASLYAQWTKKTYAVSYSANGGTGAPSSQTKTYDVDLTLSSTKPTRADTTLTGFTVTLKANYSGGSDPSSLTAARTKSYSFRIWNTAADGSGTDYASGGTYSANAAVTMYAQWNSSTTTASVDLPTPTRTGYDFQGWSTDSSAPSGITGSYTPTGNVTLYAIWKLKTYTISYNLDGGTGDSSSQTKTYGIAITLHAAPTKYGYDFYRWQDQTNYSTLEAGASYTENRSVTFKALWTRKTYTVTYDANGGTGAPDVQTKSHGIDLTLSGIEPTRDGYKFLYWQDTTTYTLWRPGDSYNDDRSTTLKAQWRLNESLFYWHWSDAIDSVRFASGASVSDALTAAAWNRAIAKVDELRDLLGQSASTIPTVSAGANITAVAFNQLRTAIGSTTGAGTVPGAVSKGDTITVSLFHGTGSLKEALNAAITAYNNS